MIPLSELVFGTHHMTWVSVQSKMADPRNWAPIEVERIAPGTYFVEDGRHRATAAYELGRVYIEALVR